MLIKRRRSWEIPEREATSESVFWNRRTLIKAAALGGIAAATGVPLSGWLMGSGHADEPDPSAGLYPAKRNEAFTLDRPLTDEKYATNYNNFYEFGMSKDVTDAARRLPVRPWTIKLDGMVEKEQELGIDDLLKQVQLEERLYRHRCVEAWSMAVPWSGFPMKALVDIAKPLSGAKYVRMETFLNTKVAPAQNDFLLPWPYVEGVTMEEARNELAFLVTGMYGKPVPKQDGAPIRLALPWKYGFKSIKSIVRFSFVADRPKSYWEALQDQEYGFWANVNPAVPHPRWSQATERVLGTNERRPTLLFNGYAEQVASLYPDPKGREYFF